jgi:hypothetical protein
MRYVLTLAMLCAAATAAHAQTTAAVAPAPAAEGRMFETRVQAARVAVESRVTRGAPYSAEAVTESVQMLADGNRIVSKNATRIFRDSEGRVRREQLNAAGTDVASITISDPVAGTTYLLDPLKREAHRNGAVFTITTDALAPALAGVGNTAFIGTRAPEAGVVVAGGERTRTVDVHPESKVRVEAETIARVGSGAGVVVAARAPGDVSLARFGMAGVPVDGSNVTREELGQQLVEGVTAVGTRTTTEIPAGAIGNEQPIKIVSEQWFSPDLQLLVLTKHSDPRLGDTTYRLSGIVRADPGPSLFELPPDYTIRESAIRREQQK